MTSIATGRTPGHCAERGRNSSDTRSRNSAPQTRSFFRRVTYQIFAAFWPAAPRDEGFADKMNGLEKYVVSTTLREATWNNTTIIRGDIPNEISRLKQRSGGDILVFGSADLVDSLMEFDLVDELRLMVFPVVLGSGKRLFRNERDTSYLRLVGAGGRSVPRSPRQDHR
jgi:dihydrofolate reductase